MYVCTDPAQSRAVDRHGAIAMIHAIALLAQRLALTEADKATLTAILHGSGGADTIDISAPRIGVLLGFTTSSAVYRLPAARRLAIVSAVGKRIKRLSARLVDQDAVSLIGYMPGTRHGAIRTVSRYALGRLWAILADIGDAGSDPSLLKSVWSTHRIGLRRRTAVRAGATPWRGVESALSRLRRITDADCQGGGAVAVAKGLELATAATEQLEKTIAVLRGAQRVLGTTDGPCPKPKAYGKGGCVGPRGVLSTGSRSGGICEAKPLAPAVHAELDRFSAALTRVAAWAGLRGVWTTTTQVTPTGEVRQPCGAFAAGDLPALRHAVAQGEGRRRNTIVTIRAPGFWQVDDVTNPELARAAGAVMILHTGGSCQAWFWTTGMTAAAMNAIAVTMGGNTVPGGSCRVPGSTNRKHGTMVRCELCRDPSTWQPLPLTAVMAACQAHVPERKPTPTVTWRHRTGRARRYPFYNETKSGGYGGASYDRGVCQAGLRGGWTHAPRDLARWLAATSPMCRGDLQAAWDVVIDAGLRSGLAEIVIDMNGKSV